jgi:hypothetical protein
LADRVGRAAFLLRPVKGSPKLFADETTTPVLDAGRGRSKTGQFFAYAATIGAVAAARRPSSP